MKTLSWILSFSLLSITALRPALRADIVVDDRGSAVATDRGDAVQGVTDKGGGVVEKKDQAQGENKWLPWILGGAAALAALVAGMLIADAGGSDSDAAADAAAAAAKNQAAAEGAAAAAAAAAAAQEAAATSNSIAAAQAAADQIAAGNTPPKTKVFISGTWEGSPITVACGMGTSTFTPKIVFSNANLQAAPGGILNYNKSGNCADGLLEVPAQGGVWLPIESTQNINITLDDQFYTGRATVYAPDRLILANGSVLKPAGGFAVLLQQE